MRKTIKICDHCKTESNGELFGVTIHKNYCQLYVFDLCKHCLAEFKKWIGSAEVI